ncbi:prepilin-type N-terminal cleavage/methylation domain-containing protein [Thermodesulfovibrionales bacterium]|nr:prepilin-type N-terminal cleavage/methylation domain-containing protein [Thermodesulfovibrionales bacterium]
MLPFRHSLQSNKRSQESKSRRARESKSQDSRLTTLRLLTHNRGFSLIEMLISMAILGILLAAIATIVYSQNKHRAAQNEIVEMQNNARMAMDFVTRTMKGLDRDATDAMLSANPGWFIEGVDESDLTFITDETAFFPPGTPRTQDTHRFAITHTGVDGTDTLTYDWRDGGGDPANFQRPERQPLAMNITHFSLQRMHADGTLPHPTTFATTEKIRIIIRAETENPLPTTGAHGTMTLESSVFLRN